MKKKILLLTLVCMMTLVLLTGCGTSNASEKTEPFRVGLEALYPPFNWTQMDSSNGAVKIDGSKEYAGGYDVEIAKRIAEGLGKKLVIVKIEWDGLVPALTSGKIDAIIAGMSPTAKRKETIDFSDNYYKSDLVMVVKKDGAYEKADSLNDFKGAKITAQLNTFHYTVIDQIKGVKKQPAMDNFSAMRVALKSGIIDGYVSERPEGISAETADKDFKMVELKDGFTTSDDDTAIAVGIAKNSDLTEKINKILSKISEKEQKTLMDNAIKNQPIAN
ncbi:MULTISPECIES: transporter substrate-binding domain-containing protein [Tissierellales]|uniref:Transporter substrate-binding domain-containing protein n=1 Tax=Acidilutibacter cellobiosedens TaxID=2507161 RepID=A0A410QCA4_9FIRM|nr:MULTISPECIES: transporter substrate-binding domain-containing protein [Tissierellales]MBE6082010.1 transporter substrate-binding domain-containing protein [Tissierellaceae bacterium]QAT61692.1 transporter substrate-binding domain-containing protein [Acidilutibacter cellobiosedens]SCL82735.1 Arginine-binding extracellular protein ArtP precursor [Sporanaerobacter sp. PP17-6a]